MQACLPACSRTAHTIHRRHRSSSQQSLTSYTGGRRLQVQVCVGAHTLREAQQSDAAALAHVDAASGAAGWSSQVFLDTMSSQFNRVTVAEDGTQVVGFCCMRVIAGEAQLENMGVLPDQQGKGVGRGLLTYMLQACDCTHPEGVVCYLEVRAANTPAVNLYKSLGFKVEGKRKGFYADGADALLMTRPAAPLKQ